MLLFVCLDSAVNSFRNKQKPEVSLLSAYT